MGSRDRGTTAITFLVETNGVFQSSLHCYGKQITELQLIHPFTGEPQQLSISADCTGCVMPTVPNKD